MASNRISVLIDVAVDKANQSLTSFRKSIAEADGAAGKFKAGASSAFAGIQANAGNLAMAGGAALFAFGAKAVGEFNRVALEAGRMSEALGVPVDTMSRMIEVAGDLGIESSSLEAVLGRMNQTAGKSPAAFEAINAEIVKTESGATDVNATFLSTIDALNRIEDPAKRAAAAQQIFGRSWRDSAELIGLSSKQITDAMADVSDQQAISPDEVRKARDYREAMDRLEDAMASVTIAVGEALTPALTTIADAIGVVTGAIEGLEDKTGINLFDGLLSADFWKFGPAWDNGPGAILKEITGFEGEPITDDINGVTDAINDATGANEENTGAVDDNTDAVEGNVYALRDRITALEASEQAERGAQSASLSYRQQVADTTRAVAEATLKQLDATLTDEERAQAARDAESAVLAQADAAVKFAEEQAAANGETFSAKVKTQIYIDELNRLVATLSGPAAAEIAAHIARLRGIPASIYTNIGTTRSGDFASMLTGRRASGGPVSPGGTYLVGEQGPELLQMGSTSGNVVPNDKLGGGSGGGLTVINLTVNSLDARGAGKHIKQALDEYYKNGGAR